MQRFFLATLLIFSMQATHADILTGLVAHYPFDGNADDASGNGRDGTVVGATPAVDRFGNLGAAFSFDGDDHIEADSTGLPTGEKTVALWFLANRVSNRPVLAGYGGGSCGTSWFMGINAGPVQGQYYVSPHCSPIFASAYPEEPVGVWIHMAITSAPTGFVMYINGESFAVDPQFFVTNVIGKELAIGVAPGPDGFAPYTDGNVGYFEGSIDDVRIYDRALTASDVQELFNVALEPTALCDIQLNQATYIDGDIITADVFRIANLTAESLAVELKVWQGVPGMSPKGIVNMGADGSFVLAAGQNIDLGPLPLQTVTPDLPRGNYEFSCRILDPVTGSLLSENLNNFNIPEANIVTNSGFESGATGWIFSDGNPDNERDVGTCASPCTITHNGSWAGFKNLHDGGSGTISQSIATSIGTDYLVELWLADNNVEIGTVTASFGGTLGVSVTGADTSTTHSMYNFTHTATSVLTDFVFGGVVTSGTFFIDDVSIVAVP